MKREDNPVPPGKDELEAWLRWHRHLCMSWLVALVVFVVVALLWRLADVLCS